MKRFLSAVAVVVFLAAAYFFFPGTFDIRCAYAQATGASSCKYCTEFYCYNPEVGHRWKEIKKARARAEGLPERYMTFWDRLDDCEACVRNSPDWVHLEYVYDKEGFEKKYGHKAPYTSRSLPWSAQLEKSIRDEMREGVVKEFHIIHYSNRPCKCCRAKSQKEYQDWFDSDYDVDDDTAEGYNKDLDFHPDAAISFTDKNKLGKDPADLTEIAESYKRATSVEAPPIENYLDPEVRYVHVTCRTCEKFEREYNKYAKYINDQRRPLAQAKRRPFYARAGIDATYVELEGMGKLAQTPEVEKKIEKLEKELAERYEDLERDKRKIDTMLAQRDEWLKKLEKIMKDLLACEETACAVPSEGEEKPKTKLDDGADAQTGDNQKAVAEKGSGNAVGSKSAKKSKAKGGTCKAKPKAPAIKIGENGKYGTGAQTKKKVTETVGGALLGGAMGAISGGGMNFGGAPGGAGMIPGSGGKSSKGPKTVKDPVPKSVKTLAPSSAGGTELVLGGAFTDKGLVVSSTLEESPGNGTFHAVYLEDCGGHRVMPKEYMIFTLWNDWKLTVWWTHDRWVDGEHVLHEEGDYMDTGRNDLGTFFYRKGNETKGIWSMLGFDNATSGVKSLGTVFDLSPDDFVNGPMNLVIHTTLPAGDPVMTDPQIYQIGIGDDGKVAVTKG